jgi:hypothetical protein
MSFGGLFLKKYYHFFRMTPYNNNYSIFYIRNFMSSGRGFVCCCFFKEQITLKSAPFDISWCWFLVPYRFTGGDFRFTLRPSVCPSVRLSVRPSVHKTGSRDNTKSTENILMKLGIWIDGSMEIMHVFFFTSYVENSGCYGNK